HGRRARARRRPRAVGRGLLLPDAARRRARLLGSLLHPRKSPGRPRPQPVPRRVGRRAVGVRRLRLLRAPRGAARNQGSPVPPVGTEAVGLYSAVASSSLQALLVRAGAALERGRGAEAAQMLSPALRSSLTRDEELTVRSMQAEAALLQDDLDAAAAALGRPPDTFRDTVGARRVATLWRLHGRLASARGDQSRAIAMQARALKNAEAAHDSRGIGLAHYEVGQCYRQVGDIAIVREHISKAASALHAAGDRRHLALVHSLSSISLAQLGRYDEAMSALRQAERLASMVHADDVLATVCGNQAIVMMFQHRHEQALALAERSVSLHEAHGSGHGLAVALATLGQSCVRMGDLVRAEDALHRALDVRRPIQFHEPTGEVFDTLAQIHLVRGRYDTASDFLGRASEAYGAYGRQTSQWYE